jgi:hypothetical protein
MTAALLSFEVRHYRSPDGSWRITSHAHGVTRYTGDKVPDECVFSFQSAICYFESSPGCHDFFTKVLPDFASHPIDKNGRNYNGLNRNFFWFSQSEAF